MILYTLHDIKYKAKRFYIKEEMDPHSSMRLEWRKLILVSRLSDHPSPTKQSLPRTRLTGWAMGRAVRARVLRARRGVASLRPSWQRP